VVGIARESAPLLIRRIYLKIREFSEAKYVDGKCGKRYKMLRSGEVMA